MTAFHITVNLENLLYTGLRGMWTQPHACFESKRVKNGLELFELALGTAYIYHPHDTVDSVFK